MRAVFALWLVAIVAACDAQRCVSGGLYGDAFRECFHFFNVTHTFDDASQLCKAIGGTLVSVLDAFEQAYIIGNARKRFTGSDYWIGLSDKQTKNTWIWTDGTKATYFNWGNGFPNGNGECVATRIQGGQWYNTDCSQKLYFVCKVAPNQDYQDPNKFCAGDPIMFGKCYHYFNSVAQSNADATTMCSDLLGSLVAFHSQDEQNYLFGALKNHAMQDDYWLGLRDVNDDGHWQWDDDSSSGLSFRNWESDFPIDGVSMDCALARTANGKWYNVYCNEGAKPFICEAVIAVGTTTARPTTLPNKDVWIYFNLTESWYRFSPEEKSWDSADASCEDSGGHLTSIHSLAENDFIRGLAHTSKATWIGLHCDYSLRGCAWSDGSPLDFTYRRHFTNTARYDVCSVIYSVGGWGYYYCNDTSLRSPFVCKRST